MISTFLGIQDFNKFYENLFGGVDDDDERIYQNSNYQTYKTFIINKSYSSVHAGLHLDSPHHMVEFFNITVQHIPHMAQTYFDLVSPSPLFCFLLRNIQINLNRLFAFVVVSHFLEIDPPPICVKTTALGVAHLHVWLLDLFHDLRHFQA